MYGIFSAKWLYIISTVLFETGSAICGGAPTMNALIVGRAIAGLGGAGMYLGCLTLLSLTTSLRQRPNYMAFIGLSMDSHWLLTIMTNTICSVGSRNSAGTCSWGRVLRECEDDSECFTSRGMNID